MNVILISCDTLRADRLGCYGYAKPTSPYIDQIASEGAVFLQAFGADIPTEPVHTALFSGQLGVKTGIVAHGAHRRQLDKSAPSLPRMLWEAGYTTAACDNLYQLKEWFARGFNDYLNTVARHRFIDGKDINARAEQWLRQHTADADAEPFFLFLHYWDTHTPYMPRDEYVSRFYDGDPYDPANTSMEPVKAQLLYPFFHEYHYKHLGPVTDRAYINALYDGEVRYLDDRIRELDETLKELGLVEDTLLILMGDHGESMDEHDIYWDHAGLYDATVKVPMIMRWPNRIKAGKRIDGLVQHVDIFPTVAEAAGVTVSDKLAEKLSGQSLWPLMENDAPSKHKRIYHAECNWQASRAIRTDEWKLIENIDPFVYDRPRLELYNVKSDPHEVSNVIDDHQMMAKELRDELWNWVETQLDGADDPIDETLSEVGMPAIARLDRTLAKWDLTWQDWIENPDPNRIKLEYVR